MNAGTLNWWQLIALLGALQGLLLALALVARRDAHRSHRLLAAAILTFSLFLASVVYYSSALVVRFPQLFATSLPLPFLFGPLVYLYAVTTSDRTRQLCWRDMWHAVPAALVFIFSIPTLLLSSPEKLVMYETLRGGTLPLLAMISDPLRYLSGGVYTLATFMVLRRHRQLIAHNYSSHERVSLAWMTQLAYAAGGIWILAFALQLAEELNYPPVVAPDLLVATAITGLIYAIGFQGMRQPAIARFSNPSSVAVEAPPGRSTPPAAATPPGPEPVVPAPRYEKSGLDERTARKLEARLLNVMERERLYRRAELTLGDLAAALNTSPHRLSLVLNAQLRLSFYDFVNGYRVREVQQRLAGADGARLTYLALALEAGFASKSTFNAVFKKQTGVTPSEYRSSRAG